MTSMPSPKTPLLAVALLAGATLVTLAPAAMAQGQMPLRNQAQQRNNQGIAPERAPAALPGARSTGPARPSASTAGMKPNEALFDAVNRGDIGSAREALSRGADVDARNVLGLTPVQLSVDLGRNDITFLLLSMRNSGSGRSSAPPPNISRAAASPSRMAPAPVYTAPRRAAAAPSAPATPRPMATATATPGRDPGTPAPQAGFLGFSATP